MTGVKTPTVWLMDPVAISLVMAPSWARLPMSRGKVNFTALYREGCNTTGTLPMSPLHEWLSSLMNEIGPRASFASANVLITPSDPPGPYEMTEVIQACGKFRGSSTFLPFTSLKFVEDPQVFDELRLDLMMTVQDPPHHHPANL